MLEILKNLRFDDLEVKPPFGGKLRLSEDIQQAISLIVGWDGQSRRLIRCSPSGVIRVCDGRAKAVINVTADQAAYTASCPDCPSSEVMIKAHPENTGRIVINIGADASLVAGFWLMAGESMEFSVNNLNVIRMYIELDTERAAVLYTE